MDAAAGVDDEDDDEVPEPFDELELLDEFVVLDVLDDEESDDLLEELSDDEPALDDSLLDDDEPLELFDESRLSLR